MSTDFSFVFNVVGMATVLRIGLSEVRILLGAKDFGVLQNFQTASGAKSV
jgi:hypothetical protein